MSSVPDEICREITIQAPIERVWRLISEPGWWVNAGGVRAHELTPPEGRDGVVRVTDPEYGDFTIEVLDSSAPRAISYRWLGGAGDGDRAVVRTRIEFTLRETDEGVVVRVVEQGWADVEPSERIAAEYEENSQGWEDELAAAKRHLEAA